MTDQKIYIIVATDKNNGIGKDGKMPWHLKKESEFFKKITTTTKDPNKKNMMVMGSTTWESLPEPVRPLPDRKNVVLHHGEYNAPGATVAHSFEEAFNLADEEIETIFIIGGASVYRQMVEHPETAGLYITRLNKEFDCDTYFPEVPERFSKLTSLGKEEEKGIEFEFLLYER